MLYRLLSSLSCFLAATAALAENHRYEVSVDSVLMQSQDEARYFFADHDSSTRPLPAQAVGLRLESTLSEVWRLVTALSVPITAEVVEHKKNPIPTTYYFPKTFLLGLDAKVWETELGPEKGVELSLGFGLDTPLTPKRFAKDLFPVFSGRLRASVTADAGMTVGLGYVGDFRDGLIFIPFGVSYRI